MAVFFFWPAVLVLGAPAEGETNQAAVTYSSPLLKTEDPRRMDVLKESFFHEVMDSDNVVFDRLLGPWPRLSWVRQPNLFGYDSLDRFNSAGAHLFAKIGMDSFRTAAIEAFPLDIWQDHWLGWLTDFVSGTIGNPQEEHLELTAISYSAVRSAWENNNQNATFRWGLRPWTSSPYMYFLAQIGHYDLRPLLTLESRAGYSFFGATKIEGRVALQLPQSFRIAGSASMDPGRMRSGDSGATYFGVTLERFLGSRDIKHDAIFFLGFRSGTRGEGSNARHENLIAAGFSKPW